MPLWVLCLFKFPFLYSNVASFIVFFKFGVWFIYLDVSILYNDCQIEISNRKKDNNLIKPNKLIFQRIQLHPRILLPG